MLKNKNLLIVSLIAVVNALGYGIIIPILYSYTQKFGLTDFQNGLLFAIFSLCSFLSAPIIGRMSDKFGRKPPLIFSLIGTVASFVMMAFAPSAIFIFIARALDGITAGNFPVVAAVISDSTDPKDRAKGFGIIGAAFGFGFVFGPAISAFTLQYGDKVPFLIAAGITLVSVVLTAVFLPETNKHIGQVEHKSLFDFKKLVNSLFDPNIGKTLLITLLYAIAFGLFIYAYQPFSVKSLHLSATQISLNFTIFGLVGLITQLLIIPFVTKKVNELKILIGTVLLTMIAFAGMFIARELVFFTIVSIMLSLANAFVNPILQTLLSKEVDAKSQGSIQGVNASYQSLGFIFGPIAGGLLASISLTTPFLAGSLVTLACLFIATHIFWTSRSKPVSEF